MFFFSFTVTMLFERFFFPHSGPFLIVSSYAFRYCPLRGDRCVIRNSFLQLIYFLIWNTLWCWSWYTCVFNWLHYIIAVYCFCHLWFPLLLQLSLVKDFLNFRPVYYNLHICLPLVICVFPLIPVRIHTYFKLSTCSRFLELNNEK